MMRLAQNLVALTVIIWLSLHPNGLRADDAAATKPVAVAGPDWPQKRPVCLTDLSVGVKESYDSNVFGGLVGSWSTVALPSGTPVALKGMSSAVTTISPKLGFDFAPALGDQKTLKSLTFVYSPDFVEYHSAPSETYDAHRIGVAMKWKNDAWSVNFNENFLYVNGSKVAPFYPTDAVSAFASAMPRERREQTQERATLSIQYDQPTWFIRPIATVTDYNLSTAQYFIVGYENYVSRWDVNGGFDVGYKIQPDFALTLGYRCGAQNQSEYSFGPQFASIYSVAAAHTTADYQRVLVGFEGKPLKWLTASFQFGPDFHDFGASTPVDDHHEVTVYGEGSLLAALSPQDSVTFKYKQWQWVSSTGVVPYFDSAFDLSYTRKISDALSATLGARALGANYNPNNVSHQSGGLLGDLVRRNDWLYTIAAGLQYTFNPNCSAYLSYSYDLGVDEQGGLSGSAASIFLPRGFNHQLVSLGATFKF